MSSLQPQKNHLYIINYGSHYHDLCKLESKQLFGEEVSDKFVFSDRKLDPTISIFIRSRLDIMLASEDYDELIQGIKDADIHIEWFKAEYIVLEGDPTGYRKRLSKLKDVGYSINGFPDYYKPSRTYGICFHNKVWYFGVIIKHNSDWQKHKTKPHSFSNSIGMNTAKSLVSIASKGSTSMILLDACCGVGTILLEACFSGYNVEGCDINLSACEHTMKNLEHYNYSAEIHNCNINELNKKYDAAIIDLPYNLYTLSTESITQNIIESVGKLTSRMLIVSMSDIEPFINQAGFKVSDYCTVEKRGKSKFTRKVWLCERRED